MVRFDPDDLIYALVPPDLQAFSPDFHCATCDPEKQKSLVLK